MRSIKTTLATSAATSALTITYAGVVKAHDGPVFEEEQTSSLAPYITAGVLLGLLAAGLVLFILKKKAGNKTSTEIGNKTDEIRDTLDGIENKLKNIEENIDKHIESDLEGNG